ncbi:hypothetical protein B5S28_g737 [[Candida] boidinii]|nr:hypothetical protein B5S28_g737 [[Candida] boidinii]OWB60305.1 hypothetical protein B5S29_g1177 [[Candida] boidinii]OWB72069.1 hypothetical protein B5S31_g1770 [[Candida] boidinii]OWB77700.1 hypothetical protein B5S32_g1874 [[Candida] boidinii]
MLSSTATKRVLSQQNHVSSKRTFVLSALTGAFSVGNYILGNDIKLANQMENGELHRPKSDNEEELKKLDKPLFERPTPNYEGHVPLHPVEKLATFVGSSIGAFLHPEENKYIVALGESTAFPFVLRNLRNEMLSDPVGRQILRERPRMTSTSLDLDYLKSLPDNTMGKTYVKWLEREHCSPDTRVQVRFIDDEELAYVFQRYRECHDFYHSITDLPIVREGEIAVKFFEFLNLGIPFAGMGALFAPFNVKRPDERERLFKIYYPWALKTSANCKSLINVYWEKVMERDVSELRAELGIELPPNMRELRKAARATRKSKK